MAAYRGKRTLDLAIAVPALVLTLPVQLVVALLVRLRLGSPVLFRQSRPGLHGQTFQLVKFRTMRPVDPSRGWVDDASRLTAFGARLRATSLDELPSLVNVVRGEMSLVGPRPLLPQYLDRYTAEQARRHEVLPGLTGLAQVSGRNTLAWPERLRLDVQYVDECCVRLDLRVLLATVGSVLLRRGIAADGEVTMAEFTGPSTAEGMP
jgi:lipopolysaccharide/colanic/teichoic acid biosynthesis glycosyltransferase